MTTTEDLIDRIVTMAIQIARKADCIIESAEESSEERPVPRVREPTSSCFRGPKIEKGSSWRWGLEGLGARGRHGRPGGRGHDCGGVPCGILAGASRPGRWSGRARHGGTWDVTSFLSPNSHLCAVSIRSPTIGTLAGWDASPPRRGTLCV